MTSTTPTDRRVQTAWPVWALAGAGALLAAVGGIWWAWDADPGRGKALLLAGIVIVMAGVLLARRPAALPPRAVMVAAVVIIVFAGYEIWAAVATIISQRASRPG